jgi:DNA invertase Pin-like site-specific DNA recombinase/uncharacterized protein YqeY
VRAVAYARVSSAMQRDRETIASQLRVLPEFIARQGWILARPIETYVDDGRSAKAGNLAARLGLGALLRDAALGLFDVVVVVDVDRLTRSEDIEERGMILGAFQRARVKLASATSSQVLDLSTSTGDLFTTLHAFFAAEWTRKHRERVVQGKITAIQRGRKPAGRPPYGLAYDRATGQWAIDPVRGPFVVEMFQRVADGDSCRKIADDLHERGAPRPRGPWERHRVARIIRSRALLGTWVVDKTRNLTIAVPPVIDEDLWQRAQVALDASGRRGLRKTEYAYLLEGLCVCAACGSPMLIRSRVWDPRRNGRHQEAAYLCKGRKVFRLGAKRCMQPIVPTADADTRAWRAVVEELSDPGLAAAVAREVEGQGEDARSWEVDAEGYRQHLARLERVEAAVLDRYRREMISDAALDVELGRLSREREGVRSQLATAERAMTGASETRGRIDEAMRVLDDLRCVLADALPRHPATSSPRETPESWVLRVEREPSAGRAGAGAQRRSQRRIATGHVDMPRVSAGRGSGCVEIVLSSLHAYGSGPQLGDPSRLWKRRRPRSRATALPPANPRTPAAAATSRDSRPRRSCMRAARCLRADHRAARRRRRCPRSCRTSARRVVADDERDVVTDVRIAVADDQDVAGLGLKGDRACASPTARSRSARPRSSAADSDASDRTSGNCPTG